MTQPLEMVDTRNLETASTVSGTETNRLSEGKSEGRDRWRKGYLFPTSCLTGNSHSISTVTVL